MDLSNREGRREQGLLIQEAVDRAGFSVEELANRIGCSRALLYQYLSGTTLAQPDRLQQIATEADVPLAFFYGANSASVESKRTKRGRDVLDDPQRLNQRLQHLQDLAGAQESPQNWPALISTCEQILTLAKQINDESAEAHSLVRIGKACIRVGEFTRAIESLQKSLQLPLTRGDDSLRADAQQALGNAYLATGRKNEAREQFTNVAQSSNWTARWSGLVSLAAVAEQTGDYRRAMELCDDAAAVVDENHDLAAAAQVCSWHQADPFLIRSADGRLWGFSGRVLESYFRSATGGF